MKSIKLIALPALLLCLCASSSAQSLPYRPPATRRGPTITYDDSVRKSAPVRGNQRLGVVNPYTNDSSYLYYNKRGTATHYQYRGEGGRATTQQRIDNLYRRRSRSR